MKNKAVVKVIPSQGPSIASRMRDVLALLGEDTSREGLVQTPERYEKAMRYLTSGYHTNLEEIVNGALFTVKCDEMVIVKEIEFFSMCEHHLLPFFGKIHVGYLPKDKVLGLSKIPRIVDNCRSG
jgi:GTP cyclohydrolase I